MLTIPLTLAQASASAYVLFVGLMVLRKMTHATALRWRTAYLLLSAGALYSGISSIPAPSVSNALLAAGVAIFLACNERRNRATQPPF